MPHILIADDHDLVRDTIAAYLESEAAFQVSKASDLSGAMDVLNGDLIVDLAVLDYHMPGMNGLDGLQQVRRAHPAVRVTLLSGVASRDVAAEALTRGADGFIPKSMTAASMVNAIQFVLSGERYMPVDMQSFDSPAPFADLSRRERETLEQLCLGLSNKEIARALSVQEATIKLHIKNLMAKMGAANRTQAALMARDRQLL